MEREAVMHQTYRLRGCRGQAERPARCTPPRCAASPPPFLTPFGQSAALQRVILSGRHPEGDSSPAAFTGRLSPAAASCDAGVLLENDTRRMTAPDPFRVPLSFAATHGDA